MNTIRERHRRRARGSIDRAIIVRTALRLLEREGIAGVTTRLIGEDLGIAGPSLYWHFKDKRELLDHMAEAMIAEAQSTPDPLFHEPDWRKWLEEAARDYRRAALSRRDAAQVLAGARPTGTHPRLNYPAMVSRLVREGFSDDEAPFIIWSLGRFALGWATSEQAASARRGRHSDRGFEFGLAALLDGFEGRKAGTGARSPKAVPARSPSRGSTFTRK